MPVGLMEYMSGWQRYSVCFFSPLFLPVSRLCLRIVSLFFFPSCLSPCVRPTVRPLVAFNHLPSYLSAAMAALALAAIEAAMSGVACVDVRFRVAAMPVGQWRCARLARLAWSV
jgi:hypothetical protein